MHPWAVMCPMASDLASRRWATALPRVLWFWSSHLAEVGSATITCPTSLDLNSRLRWALALPRVLWLWISLPGWGGVQRYHVSYGSGPRLLAEVSWANPYLLAEVGSGATTCPTTPCGPWASSIKKRLAGLAVQLGTCSQCTHACFQGAWRQGHHGPLRHAGRQRSQCLQGVWIGSYNVTIVQCQHYGPLVWHHYNA
jgi:hypothetical protein